MAVVQGSRTTFGLTLEELGDGIRINSDEGVVEALLKKLNDTYNVELPTTTLAGKSRELKLRALYVAAVLVKEICIVVPNEVNRIPSGDIHVTRELRANLREINALGVLDEATTGVLLRRREVRSTILLVSKCATEAMLRYCNSLERGEGTPRRRNNDSSCTIM